MMISLNSINCLVFVVEVQCSYCELVIFYFKYYLQEFQAWNGNAVNELIKLCSANL